MKNKLANLSLLFFGLGLIGFSVISIATDIFAESNIETNFRNEIDKSVNVLESFPVIETNQSTQSTQITSDSEETNEKKFIPRLPKKDPSLPSENKVRIPALGVEAKIDNTADPDDSLSKGAWLDPNFKTPSGNALLEDPVPVIIASHLYGDLDWTDEFRNNVAFAGLDSLPDGSIIEIIWQQRKYVYSIESGEVNDKISDYNYDLILYTCVDLSGSDLRTIRYANLDEELTFDVEDNNLGEENTNNRGQS